MLQMLLAGADGVQSGTDLLACADADFKKYGRKLNLIQKEYAHDAIATCIRNFSSVVCTMYLHYCVANSYR